MMFLLADPTIVYLDLPNPPRLMVLNLVNRIRMWNDLRRNYDIRIAMTERCRNAISQTLQQSYNSSALKSLFESLSVKNDIINLSFPLLDSLLAAEDLDPLLREADDLQIDYAGLESEMIHPRQYVETKPSDHLRSAFYDMLRRVVIAREHSQNPPEELRETAVLTIFEGDKQWYRDHLENVFIIVGWDPKLPNRKIVEALPVIDADLDAKALEELLEVHTLDEFNSVFHAVDEAVSTSKGLLVLPSQSKRNVKKSVHFDNKRKIYRALLGLVEIWLPAYYKGGQDEANLAYKAKFGYEVSSDYGESTIENPTYVRDITVRHEGEHIICERHIKMSDFSGEFRIHFQEQKMPNGDYRLILGWIGRHTRTSKYKK